MDSRIKFYKAAFFQRCNDYIIPVLRGTSRYHYGKGLGDVLRGIVRFIPKIAQFLKPVAIKGAQTLLKAGSEAIKESATVKDLIKSTLKPTVGAGLGATVDQVASKLIKMQNNQNDAPLPNPPIVVPELIQADSSKRGAVNLYLRPLNVQSINVTSDQLSIIFKMATIGGDVTEQITSEVNLFGSIMQQNVIENEFNSEYAPLATIQQCMAIEFVVKGTNDLYLDLKNSRLHVLAKITKADGTNIDANTAGPINLTLHSMFREIGLELNGRNVGDTSQLYPYRSHLETFLNFCKET